MPPLRQNGRGGEKRGNDLRAGQAGDYILQQREELLQRGQGVSVKRGVRIQTGR